MPGQTKLQAKAQRADRNQMTLAVGKDFTADPFNLTVTAEKDKITGWTGKATGPVKATPKAAPKAAVKKKK